MDHSGIAVRCSAFLAVVFFVTIATNFQRNPFGYAGLEGPLHIFLCIFVPFSRFIL